MSKPEEVDKMRRLLKPLREVTELYEWIVHTRKMIEKVEGLKGDRETLGVIIPEVIFVEDCKRWFERGNKKEVGGLAYLVRYLELDHVVDLISKEERAYTQIEKTNNNKINLMDYVERKKKLLLAKEKKFREDEEGNFQELFRLIKQDMSAEDEKLIGVRVRFKDYDELIEHIEVILQVEKKEREEMKVVASMTTEKKEAGNETKEEVFEGKCFNCQENGHRAKDCKKKKKKRKTAGDLKKIKCFKCGEMGHYASNCNSQGNNNNKNNNKNNNNKN